MKLSGPKGIGLKVMLYNLAAVLLTLLLGVFLFGGKSGPSSAAGRAFDSLFERVFMVLMFPASLLQFITIHTDSPRDVFIYHHVFPVLNLLNPVVWGVAGFAVARARRRRKDYTEHSPGGDSLKSAPQE